MGECKPSKSGKGLRQVIVKIYERESVDHIDCRSKLSTRWEVCDYKKEKEEAKMRSKKT